MLAKLMNSAVLAELLASERDMHSPVSLPAFERVGLDAGVVHLGLGAFHRAHQAMVFNQLLGQGDMRWGVHGIAINSTQLADTLARQDGLYSVQIASANEVHWSICGSMLKTSVAAREREQVLAAIASPATRWLTLTVTEKGYTAELAQLINEGLAARHETGLPGLTIASCDNLKDNGDKLKRLCLDALDGVNAPLQDWIAEHCAFPNSMVDRIVPAATAEHRAAASEALGVLDDAALGTEGFWEWVIEDHFVDPSDGEALRSVGVQVVGSVKPFEDAKLRMLNGSHTALAQMGPVLGYLTVSDAIADPLLKQFVYRYMTETAMTGLTRPGLDAYRDALLQRFANPHLRHRLHQVATDSSKKIPERWLPTLQSNLDAGRNIDLLALACAAWMRYLQGVDEAGNSYVISDPQASTLQALALEHRSHAEASVHALLSVPSIWGPAWAADPRFAPRVVHWLRLINEQGVAAALREC